MSLLQDLVLCCCQLQDLGAEVCKHTAGSGWYDISEMISVENLLRGIDHVKHIELYLYHPLKYTYEVRQQKSAGVLERLLQIIEEDF